jgi:hypothetical protein
MNNEILTFNWDDLDEHFDDEKDIIELDASVTLDEVWTAFDTNNIAAIQQWLAKDLLRAISDDTANAWFDNNQLLNALETDEWILLQVAPVAN